MSAIATFTLLPKSCLEELREAAVPKILQGEREDGFWDFLQEHGKEMAGYEWSGYIMAVLIPCLQQEYDIDLSPDSEFDDLATFLCNVREASTMILTESHRRKYLDQLNVEDFDEDELREFFEQFNEVTNPEAGKAMLDGIAAVRESLTKIGPDSIVLLSIG